MILSGLTRHRLFVALPVTCFVGYLAVQTWGNAPVDFNTQVKPILNKNCIACHGGVKRAAGFSLLFRDEALAPTESGKPAILPGDPGHSEFIKRLTHADPDERMPYKADPLKPEEIDILTRWVEEGAEWGNHWAYVAPKAVDVPGQNSLLASAWPFGSRWERNEIDYFVTDKLKRNEVADQLNPSPEADRAILLRRVCLDLTGLPPTPAQRDRFLNDPGDTAYETVVDNLLASPQFGERWASMWLDLARYSDSRGYQKDNERSIWRYRDWVIRAFNRDMPFDQFTVEQLAGDLLAKPTKDQLIATAFHRNTMNNDETGTVDEEFRVAALLDRVNTTWDVWHGTTFGCVQCHSHPYDPFHHEDYYKFMAFLNNTRDEDTQDEAPTMREFKPNDARTLDSLTAWIQTNVSPRQADEMEQFLTTREPRFQAHYADQYVNGALVGDRAIGGRNGGSCRLPDLATDEKSHFLMAYSSSLPGGTMQIHVDEPTGPVIGTFRVDTAKSRTVSLPLVPQSGRHDLYLTFQNPGTKPTDDFIKIAWFTLWNDVPGRDKPGYARQQQRFRALFDAKTEQTPILLENRPAYRRKTHVFVRGNWLVNGTEVQPDVPKSLHPFPDSYPRNRLGLAKWLVSKDDPLTARTVVNRFWEQLFGLGLVETLEDFGTQGAKPTHPELLDFLAVRFMNDYQWRPKALLKMMVMSATYRQDSRATPARIERDPANRLLARGPRIRLTAEQVRDQALAVSGLLSKKMYGKPVMPYQPEGVWQAVNSSLKWEQSTGEDQYRRSIYTFTRRTSPYPSMVTFDASSREVCLSRRVRTNTPLQALVLLNDPVFVEAARHLAQRMEQYNQTPAGQIRAGYRLAIGRDLTDRKLSAFVRLYNTSLKTFTAQQAQMKQFLPDSPTAKPAQAALTMVAHTILNTDEFVTKE